MERDGLLERTAFPTIPPRVDDALTALGTTLTEPISKLAAWPPASRLEIESAQARYGREENKQ
jgi:DNA-binding HxlR family transcriptional regulator